MINQLVRSGIRYGLKAMGYCYVTQGKNLRFRIHNTDFFKYINLTLKEGKNVKSQDSPVPRNASDMTGGQDSRAPNTAWSVSLNIKTTVNSFFFYGVGDDIYRQIF
jgi:hypothetical protein